MTPEELEELIEDANENGANYRTPIDWAYLGPKLLALWKVAKWVEANGNIDCLSWGIKRRQPSSSSKPPLLH